MVREGVCDVDVVDDEVADEFAAEAAAVLAGAGAGGVYVCASVCNALTLCCPQDKNHEGTYAEKNRPVPVMTVMVMSSRLSTSRRRSPSR